MKGHLTGALRRAVTTSAHLPDPASSPLPWGLPPWLPLTGLRPEVPCEGVGGMKLGELLVETGIELFTGQDSQMPSGFWCSSRIMQSKAKARVYKLMHTSLLKYKLSFLQGWQVAFEEESGYD